MLDLLVIGAGLTGLSAAIRAAEAGLSVRVITKGLSALHWGAGTIDLLGYLPDNSPVELPLAALDQLPARHPLRLVEATTLRQSLAELQEWLAAQGLEYVTAEDEANLWLPSAVGARRPTFLAPCAQASARLDDPAPLLVVGFDRLREFYPALLADNLVCQGHPARAHLLPLSLLMEYRHDANNVHLAEAFEKPAHIEAIANALRPLVNPGERVAFPAILGLSQHSQVMTNLAEAIGAPVAEIPTLPPSVPGLRLHRALVKKLQMLGARVESNMEAIEFATEGEKVAWVATSTSARPLRHRARAYLLATGGFLGGGFNSDHTGRIWETVFDLPLTMPSHRQEWFRPQFLNPSGHPIFQGGVETNAAWQPVNVDGQPIYSNLWAAGNLLAHSDAIRTRSREAVAVETGGAATHSILQQKLISVA